MNETTSILDTIDMCHSSDIFHIIQGSTQQCPCKEKELTRLRHKGLIY